MRLFNRTTRSLKPTESGRLFYEGARRVLEAIEEAEAAVVDVTQSPRGTLFVAAPLGLGRRLVAPLIPAFKAEYPRIDLRLRLSDRVIDVTGEGLDVAFHLGLLEDSTLKIRAIADCPRLLCRGPGLYRPARHARGRHGTGPRPARLPEPALPGGEGIPMDAANAREAATLRDPRTV